MPRILFISSNAWEFGGAEVVLFRLLKRLPSDWKYSLIISKEGRFSELLKENGFEFSIIDYHKKNNTYLYSLKKTAEFLKSSGSFDLIVCNASKPARIMLLLKFMVSCPVIYYAHGKRDIFTHFCFSFFLSGIVSVSDFIAKTFPGFLRHKVRTIHNGTESLDMSDLSKKDNLIKFKIPRSVCVIGSIGRLVSVKGYDVFIRAIPNILKQFPETWFVVAGEGGELESLKILADDLCVSHRLVFLGFCKEIKEVLSILDIFVFPSVWDEPFGLTLIEAMKANLPLVASEVGGVPEIVINGETGFLFERNDHNKLSEACIKLLKDPVLRKKMGESGKKKADKDFSEQYMTDNFYNYCRELMGLKNE